MDSHIYDDCSEITKQARLNLNQKFLNNEEKKSCFVGAVKKQPLKENFNNSNENKKNITVPNEVLDIMEKFELNLKLSEILMANLGEKILELAAISEKFEKFMPSNRKKEELDPYLEIFDASIEVKKKSENKKSLTEVEINNPEGGTIVFTKKSRKSN